MSDITTIGIDLEQTVFQLQGVGAGGRVLLRPHMLTPNSAKVSHHQTVGSNISSPVLRCSNSSLMKLRGS